MSCDVISCLSFSNKYFDKVVVTVPGSFTRDIRNTGLKNSLENCFSSLNLIYIGKSEKEVKQDFKLVLGYEIMVSRTFLLFEKTEKFW